MFDELRAKVATWDSNDEALVYSRFNPVGSLIRLVEGAPYNRSFRLTLANPVGHALLIHGLSDSPYSMKALAETLHALGFAVTALRLPGQGTLPSMMTEMNAGDWTAAVRMAARDVAGRATAGQLFYVGGYSTGGTLALQYALDALDDVALRRSDRVLLVSPAIELTGIAALAAVIDLVSIVPVPLLEKVRWQEIAVEYDPYKFNSFPVNATRQANRATHALQHSLARARDSGRIAQIPPVVTWQSVVDSTVGATAVADTLHARLRGAGHRLILFEVNRQQALDNVQRAGARRLIERLSQGERAYALDIVTNTDRQSSQVSVHHLPTWGLPTVRETALNWPVNLVSLGHLALPFPPDDPAYGMTPGSGRDGIASIGSWLPRGENGTLTITLGSLTRPRSNPFWSLIEEEVGTVVAADRMRMASEHALLPGSTSRPSAAVQ